jgi:hypothetical protein
MEQEDTPMIDAREVSLSSHIQPSLTTLDPASQIPSVEGSPAYHSTSTPDLSYPPWSTTGVTSPSRSTATISLITNSPSHRSLLSPSDAGGWLKRPSAFDDGDVSSEASSKRVRLEPQPSQTPTSLISSDGPAESTVKSEEERSSASSDFDTCFGVVRHGL